MLKKTASTSPTPPPSKVEGILTPKSHLTIEEQSLEDGKLQIFFLIAKIISFLIIIIKKEEEEEEEEEEESSFYRWPVSHNVVFNRALHKNQKLQY